jgi:hypothetical protein
MVWISLPKVMLQENAKLFFGVYQRQTYGLHMKWCPPMGEVLFLLKGINMSVLVSVAN